VKKSWSFVGLPYSVLSRTPTIQQMVKWGYIESSLESDEVQTRTFDVPAEPDSRRTGICRMCEKTRTVNAEGHCAKCWARSFGWMEIRGQDESRSHNRRLVTAAAAQDVGARWDSYFPPERNEMDYHPPAPRLIPARSRPWQRHRYSSSRTAPERLYRGDSLRCMVCLRIATALPHDQVCEACEKDRRRKGRPCGIVYDRWLINRRVSQWDKSPEQIAAYDSAKFLQLVRSSVVEKVPLGCDVATVIFRKRYNNITDSNASSERHFG
jgi:hypothetical protein